MTSHSEYTALSYTYLIFIILIVVKIKGWKVPKRKYNFVIKHSSGEIILVVKRGSVTHWRTRIELSFTTPALLALVHHYFHKCVSSVSVVSQIYSCRHMSIIISTKVCLVSLEFCLQLSPISTQLCDNEGFLSR